jgi:MOSC domain-containing protein YiiM
MLGEVPIVSVNTGIIALLGEQPGRFGRMRKVYSGIRKSPVLGGTDLYLGPEGLEDIGGHKVDEQADKRMSKGRRIHGGPLKAIYAYPRSHYENWVAELGVVLVPGDFGENLTVDDVTENDVKIGELWRWGEAILRVTGPRRPCYKLNMLRGAGTAEAMMQNGRCGWYFSVVRTGRVPTTGTIHILHRLARGVTIAEAFQRKTLADPTVPQMQEE